MTDQRFPAELVGLAAEVVSAFVCKNSVPAAELPALISSVHVALETLGKPTAQEAEKTSPRMSIKKTITPDYLISLEDGRRYKSLRRHLGARGLTPEQYREKWGLPHDYPMVAPSYSARRSELARNLGLGRKNAGSNKRRGRKKAD